MKSKKGISLVVLVITIIVMTILAGLIIINVFDSTKEANLVAFREELKTVLEASNRYFLEKGVYPVVEGIEYSKNDLLNIVPENGGLIQEEIDLNKDRSDAYYKVDMSLISDGVGLVGNTSDAGDFYVINKNASQIYYPKGLEVRDVKYFSLSTKLDPNKQVIEDNSVTGNIQFVSNTSAIILTKSTDEWTNELTINLYSTLSPGESAFYDILGETNTATDILDSSITIANTSLSDFQKEALKTLPVVTAEKKDLAGVVIASSTLDISNLDCVAPISNGEPDFIAYDDYNLVNFKNVTDDKSGLKNIYYVQAEETETISVSDIISNGKKVGADYIRLYKHISNVKVVFEDAVGNLSEAVNVVIPEDLVKLYGDLNSDGEVTPEDAVIISQYLEWNIELTGLQKALADVNLDGVVDEEDADIMALYIAKNENVTELPVFESEESAL